MHLLGLGTALPPHRYPQEALIEAFERVWAKEHFNVRRVRQFHEAVRVGARNLALPIDAYERLDGFGDANDAFIEVGTDLAAQALTRALDAAGLTPEDVDVVVFTSVTGIATPSLDARLFHRLGLRPDVRRLPLFGLGCVAGAAGIARVADLLRGQPDGVGVLISVELCSLTLQRQDLSVANLISSGLFGDGAAAVVIGGDDVPRVAPRVVRDDEGLPLAVGGGPEILASASRLYPDSERVMGWDITSDGLKIVLDKSVPDVVHRHLAGDVDGFLAAHDLGRNDIAGWVCHPGGPKVLQAFEAALGLTRDDLARTWTSLEREGNLSSASVLFVMRDTLADDPPPAGQPGLLLAMGPGFCSELVLLRW